MAFCFTQLQPNFCFSVSMEFSLVSCTKCDYHQKYSIFMTDTFSGAKNLLMTIWKIRLLVQIPSTNQETHREADSGSRKSKLSHARFQVVALVKVRDAQFIGPSRQTAEITFRQIAVNMS